MKHTSLAFAAMLGSALFASTPAGASIYGPGEGYYYIARSLVSGFPVSYQYMSVGPFAEEEDCWQTRNADYGNGDAWMPYDGTGIQCDWIFHGEVSALEDGLSHWNGLAGGGSPGAGGLDLEHIEAIATLQRGYAIERYKAELSELLRTAR